MDKQKQYKNFNKQKKYYIDDINSGKTYCYQRIRKPDNSADMIDSIVEVKLAANKNK